MTQESSALNSSKGDSETVIFIPPVRLAVFCSGAGTTLRLLMNSCRSGDLAGRAEIAVVVLSKSGVGAKEIARSAGVETLVWPADTPAAWLLHELALRKVDCIPLAGFLRLLDPVIVNAYRGRILNLHPALLPKFGGQGMFGLRVHTAVLAAGEKTSGATVHLVDTTFDTGPILAQESVPVLPADTPETLAARVQEVERGLYPRALAIYIDSHSRRPEGRLAPMNTATACESEIVLTTDIPVVKLFGRGKVRDLYDLDDQLLFVTTDRLSAFDVVLPDGIPGKGKALTAMSLFWFDYLRDIIPSHLVTADVGKYPAALAPYRPLLEGRSMLVRKARRVDIECVVRGYISGSLWKELREARAKGESVVHGASYAAAIVESSQLPEPLFTPATKSDSGHDESISFAQMVSSVGVDLATRLRDVSVALYQKAAAYARAKGVLIADTKFEFGFLGDKLILIDEALTPDSSRFWPAAEYTLGKSQPSYDKQIVRDYLLTLNWNKTAPGPKLPPEIIRRTAARYNEIVALLTGRSH